MNNKHKELYKKTKTIKELLEKNLIGTKGKRQAQAETEQLIKNQGLKYSKGTNPSYTHYYLSINGFPGSISLFVEYNTSSIVTGITIY